MPNFMREGGAPMWFILLFGGATLIGAILFARRPDELRLGVLRALTLATLFTSLAGFVAGVAKTFGSLLRIPPPARDNWPFMALKGVSESCANLVFAFSLLSLAWLVIAIGLRRLAAKESAA